MSTCKEGYSKKGYTVTVLIDRLFTVLRRSQAFFAYDMETSTGEGLQTVDLCSAIRAFRLRVGRGLYRATPAIANQDMGHYLVFLIPSEGPSAGPPFSKIPGSA
jgi:hypothetical protein